MGLYDDVICEYPLPEVKAEDGTVLDIPSDVNFQTKDLDCYMTRYVIDVDGILWEDHANYEPIPEEERGGKLFPIMRVVNREMVKQEYHGYFSFYSGWREEHFYNWVTFKVKYTDGVLQEITVTEVDHRPVKDNKILPL